MFARKEKLKCSRHDFDRDGLAAQVFAVDLDRCGGQDLDVLRAQNSDTSDALHPFDGYVQHVPSVSQGIRSLEQNDLEMVVVKRCAAGDLQVASVVPDAADQCEPTLVNPIIHPHFKLLHALEKRGRSSGPVGQLSRGVLKTRAYFVHNVGIQACTRHEEKVARAEAA